MSENLSPRKEPEGTTDSRSTKTYEWLKKVRKIISLQNIWTIMPVFLTALVVYFMYVQYRVSEDTARRQLRAYLVPINPKLAVPPESLFVYIGKSLEMMYTIRNDGQTPAYDVRDSVYIRVLPREKEPKTTPNSARDFYYPIYGAGAAHSRKIHSGNCCPLTEEHFFKVDTLWKFDWVKFDIYFWGRVEYTDIFRERHWTNFCYHFVIDDRIREFRTYGKCNQADRKKTYKPWVDFFR